MPRRPVLRLLVASVLAASLGLQLAGCSAGEPSGFPATGPDSDPVGAAAAAVVDRADRGYAGARIDDVVADGSMTIVPPQRNGALVVYLHGWGQTRWALLERPGESRVSHALVDAGFTVLGADGGLKAWGDPASVADYRRLIASALRRYGLHDVFLMGESMGGLATIQLARELPAVRAVTAWYPVCDLRTMTQARFQSTIDQAWRGLDRAAVSPVQAPGKPMLIWASPHDTVVTASRNAAVCAAEGRAAGGTVTYFRTSGQHGDPSNFDPATVLHFFEQHRTPGA